MRVLVGTYRKRKHVEAALRSLEENVSGVTDLVFIDDSGSKRNSRWLANYGKVVEVGKKGYAAAMQATCESAEGQDCFLLEEDWTFLVKVSLPELQEKLHKWWWLAQICLLRAPISPEEIECGGIVEMFRRCGDNVMETEGLIVHTSFFSCNPSVCRGEVFEMGWPQLADSEVVKTRELVAKGYKFAYLPGIAIEHHGKHSGFGY
jgi:GT2 family glycosyltransferase